MKFRRIAAYVLNNFCGLGVNQVTTFMKNISNVACAKLIEKRYLEFMKDERIKALVI